MADDLSDNLIVLAYDSNLPNDYLFQTPATGAE